MIFIRTLTTKYSIVIVIIREFADISPMSTCHTHVREAREISSQKLYSTSLSYKMEENEESSVNVTNDSEDST